MGQTTTVLPQPTQDQAKRTEGQGTTKSVWGVKSPGFGFRPLLSWASVGLGFLIWKMGVVIFQLEHGGREEEQTPCLARRHSVP